MDNNGTVQAIFDYMQKRAESEGVPHDLDLNFYSDFLDKGMTEFFGVIISNEGYLVEDTQNPEFFKSYFNKEDKSNGLHTKYKLINNAIRNHESDTKGLEGWFLNVLILSEIKAMNLADLLSLAKLLPENSIAGNRVSIEIKCRSENKRISFMARDHANIIDRSFHQGEILIITPDSEIESQDKAIH